MKVRVLADKTEVARAAADLLEHRLRATAGEVVLGLPTGRTAVPFYDELARRHAGGEIDLSAARGFNLDELLLPPGHPASFRRFMAEHAWGRTGLAASRCELPNGASDDPEGERERYERAIAAAGGIGLAVLGLGEDGHVAYNLPGSVADGPGVRLVELPDEQADRLGVERARRPLSAITVGLSLLNAADALLMMATGSHKARAVAALLRGPADPRWPCSLLRDHRRFDLVVDRAAAAEAGGTGR